MTLRCGVESWDRPREGGKVWVTPTNRRTTTLCGTYTSGLPTPLPRGDSLALDPRVPSCDPNWGNPSSSQFSWSVVGSPVIGRVCPMRPGIPTGGKSPPPPPSVRDPREGDTAVTVVKGYPVGRGGKPQSSLSQGEPKGGTGQVVHPTTHPRVRSKSPTVQTKSRGG